VVPILRIEKSKKRCHDLLDRDSDERDFK